MTNPFVGRRQEIGALAAQFEQARSGAPTAVLVHGPAGIGKTSLVDHWLGGIMGGPEAGPRLVRIAAVEDEAHLDHGVLSRLGPRIGLHDAGGPGADPLLVGAALVDAIGTATTAGAPLVLLVDDLQWCDTASRRALAFALRRLHAEPVLCVLLSRDGTEVVPEAGRLVEQVGGRQIPLAGLTTRDAGELGRRLGRDDLDGAGVERLRVHAAGNPLYLTALLREVDRAEPATGAGALPAPRVYTQLVAERFDAAPEPARHLTAGASVLGVSAPLALAARIGSIDDPVAALQAAVDAGLLTAAGTPPGSSASFPHALDRAAVYHLLGPAERTRLHRRAAALVEPAAALDHRLAATLDADDDLAREVVDAARREAAAGSAGAAAAHLLAAARITASPARRQRWTIEAATERLRAGHVAAAAELIGTLEALADSGPRSLALGLHALFHGDQVAAERFLADAWSREHGGGDRHIAAEASAFLAQLCSIQVRVEDTIRWAHRALDASGDRYLAPAFSVLVCQLWFSGRTAEAIELLGGTGTDGDAAPDEPDLLLVRGLVRLWSNGHPDALAHLHAAVARCRPLLASRTGIIALAYLAEAAFRAGRWDEAVTNSTLAASLADSTDQSWVSALVHGMATLPLAGRGQWTDAEVHARRARAAADALGDLASVGYAVAAGAMLAHCRRDPSATLAAVAPAVANSGRPSFAHPAVHYAWRVRQAEALVAVGRWGDAADVIADHRARCRAWSLPASEGDLERVAGLLAVARGDHDGAFAAFARAQELLADAGAPWELASTELAWGEALRRVGRRLDADDHLRRARARFLSLGAQPFIERCDRELAATGLRPVPRSEDRARLRLTPQELAVARLVAAGATNREAAQELVISTKTVEYHLSSVYRKLGVSSRHGLGTLLDHEPDPGPLSTRRPAWRGPS